MKQAEQLIFLQIAAYLYQKTPYVILNSYALCMLTIARAMGVLQTLFMVVCENLFALRGKQRL